MGKHDIGASVESLNLSSGPSAILRRVARIVIYPVQRQAIWPSAHIIKESCVSTFRCPSIANCYASTAISCVCMVRWLLASFEHGSPNFVFRPPAFKICPVNSFWHCFKKASTRLYRTTTQMTKPCNFGVSARACAPHFVYFSSMLNNG